MNPTAVMWAWAPGMGPLLTPSGTGFPMMGDSGCDMLMVTVIVTLVTVITSM